MRGLPRQVVLAIFAVALAAGASWAGKQAAVKRLYSPNAKRLPDGAIVKIGRNGHMNAQAYHDLREASIALLKKYPPTDHVYIGLGRDPAPFIAFLQAIGTNALNFPASGGYITRNKLLYEHFEKLIPKSVRFGVKKIVLIDQTSSGKTHASIMPALRSYLARKGSKTEVVGVAFYGAERVSRRVQGLSTINTTRFPEVDRFLYDPYEGVVSPFERHVPNSDEVETLTWRPQYERFKAAIVQRIRRDAKLDRFLSRFHGNAKRLTRAQAWKMTPLYQKGLRKLKDGPLLTIGDDELPVLDAKGYASISSAARAFLEVFPPEDGRFYLGVGRSATPIMAFLENLGAKQLGYLPVDGLDTDNGVTKKMKDRLATYLENTIPAKVLAAGQPITLYQRADGGETLVLLKEAAEKLIEAKKSQSTVEVVTIARAEASNEQDIPHISTKGHDQLSAPGYAASSKYAYHQIDKHDLSDLTPRTVYARFKKAMLERMKRDRDLADYLNALE